MKKNGFTLIELLGVLVILIVIALILTPSINKTVNDFKKENHDKQIMGICLSFQNYKTEFYSVLPTEDGETTNIPLSILKGKGYIDKNLKNPLTGKKYSDNMLIKITKDGKNYTCQVLENTGDGENIIVENAPTISLKGKDEITLDVNEPFIEPGYKATTSNNNDITDYVTREFRKNGNLVHEIDTSEIGTYTIKYSITYNGIKGASVTRKVIVKDDRIPVIIVKDFKGGVHRSDSEEYFNVTFESGETFIPPKATVEDNSKEEIEAKVIGGISNIPGVYDITYEAIDSSKNKATIIMKVTVQDTIKPTVEVLNLPTGYINTNFTIAINAKDSGSGLAEAPYSFDGGNTWTRGNTLIIDRNQTILLKVKDNAGNIYEEEIIIDKIDKTAPNIEFAVTSGEEGNNYWYKSNIKVKMTPNSNETSIKNYKYCITTEDTCTPNISVTGGTETEVTLSEESKTNKICFIVESVSGLKNENCSRNYKIDKTAPVIFVNGSIIEEKETIYRGTNYVVPSATAVDNLTENISVTPKSAVTPLIAGNYKVTYEASDEAGNTATFIHNVTVYQLTATDLYYDNSKTGLDCIDTQCAIDKLAEMLK